MPEAMVVKQMRLLFSGPARSAAEVKQGMVCELEVQVEQQAEQQSPGVQLASRQSPSTASVWLLVTGCLMQPRTC